MERVGHCSYEKIKQNDPTLTRLTIDEGSAAELAELGECIGMNTYLKKLRFDVGDHRQRVLASLDGNVAFFDGLKRNSSIHRLELAGFDLSRGAGREILTSFREANKNLTYVGLRRCGLGNGGGDCFMSTLSRFPNMEGIYVHESNVDLNFLKNIVSSVRDKHQFNRLSLNYDNIGFDGCQSLARLLGEHCGNQVTLNLTSNWNTFTVHCNYESFQVADNAASSKRLKSNTFICQLEFVHCDLSRETGRNMLTALKKYDINLRRIRLDGCTGIGNGESNILASTLETSKNVEEFTVRDCNIDDDLMEALVSSIRRLCKLKKLDFSRSWIAADGFGVLATLLRDPTCNIVTLDISDLSDNFVFGDDCATVLADALRSNCKLENLILPHPSAVARKGWKAFARALCVTSSINETYSSNHTLKNIGGRCPLNLRLRVSMLLNNDDRADKKKVAIKKVLRYHRRFDMKPFFRWDMKMLTSVVDWFDGARSRVGSYGAGLDARKLDSIYQGGGSTFLMSRDKDWMDVVLMLKCILQYWL